MRAMWAQTILEHLRAMAKRNIELIIQGYSYYSVYIVRRDVNHSWNQKLAGYCFELLEQLLKSVSKRVHGIVYFEKSGCRVLLDHTNSQDIMQYLYEFVGTLLPEKAL